jgi:hypothetical protein
MTVMTVHKDAAPKMRLLIARWHGMFLRELMLTVSRMFLRELAPRFSSSSSKATTLVIS